MQALEGIKVLDLSRLAPGPFCTMILGDLGAEVIRVDAGGGRVAVNTSSDAAAERARAFNPEGRNKKSIVLNLTRDDARQVFYKLAQRSDVIVEGFRPGVTKRLGVDYETVKKINPRLVYCSLTGYGQTGKYKDMVGHDINYISIGGGLGIIGEKGRRPVFPLNLLADYAGGGMHAAVGVLAALMARQRTGKGQYVDIAMVDGVISLAHMPAMQYFLSGKAPRRGEGNLNGGVPYYGVYECKDGKWLSIGSLEPAFYENLCKGLGREEFLPHQGNQAKHEEMLNAFREAFKSKTRDEWFEILNRTETCVAPVLSMDEVFADPHVKERKMVLELEHPKAGKVRQVGVSVKLSETPGSFRSFAPAPGEHTDEILSGLGYSKADIDGLKKAGGVA